MASGLTLLQESFIDFMSTKKTFNLSVLKVRLKWWYSTHKDLVYSKEQELLSYKEFIDVVSHIFNIGDYTWLSSEDLIDIYTNTCLECNEKYLG